MRRGYRQCLLFRHWHQREVFQEKSFSKRKKVDSSLPPVQKLVTPQSISVSSSLRKIRPSLSSMQSNANSCRTQSSDKHKGKGNHEPDIIPQQTSFSYPTFSTPASNGFGSTKGGGKMMRERGSTKPSEEEVEVPCLPAIPLPISMTALPKFSLNTEQRTSPLSVRQAVSNKASDEVKICEKPCTISSDAPDFNFSKPVVKAVSSSEEPTTSPVGFTFRAPALKTSSPHENTKSMLSSPEIPLKVKSPITINSSSTKKAEEEQVTFCKPAQSLKAGSVLDILRSPGFQSTSSQQTRTSPAKSAVSSPKPLTFGQKSKQALGIWYCDCCLLENKASDNKCIACSTVKDQAMEVTKQSTTLATTTPSKNTSPLKCTLGFGDKFKVAPGTWDCDTCLVQNKPEETKCVACGSPKPGTGAKDPLLVLPTTKPDKPVAPPDSGLTLSPSLKFEELARKPLGSWECTVCCVQNKAEDNKCVACTSPKPGVSTATTSFPASLPATQGELQGFGKTSFSSESTFPPVKFGLPPSSDPGEQKSSSSTDSSSTNKVSFSFTFGQTSKSLDEKDFTFVPTTGNSNTVSTPFHYGFTSSASAEKDSGVKLKTDFQFGTAPSKPESSSNSNLLALSAKEKSVITPSFVLKEPEEKNTETPVVSGFTFGKLDQKEAASSFAFGKNEEKTESTPAATSIFGSKSDGEQPKTFMFGKPESGKADTSTLGTFGFGAPNPAEKKEADQPAKPVFAFGPSATETGSSKPVFGFQGNGSSSAPQSSSIGSSSSVFGSVPQTSSSNVFGSAVQSNTAAPAGGTPAPSSTVFSSATSLTASSGTSNVFGGALSSNSPAGSNSIFGSVPASGTSTTSSIVFGSVASVNTSSSSNVFGSAAPTNTSANSNTLFGNPSTSTNPSSVPFVFGQPTTTTTAGGSMFGSGNESKSTFGFAGQESKPAETSASTASAAVTPFVFGANASTPAASGFNFGGTNTSNSTGTSSTPFVFGAGQSAPAASGLAATSSVPTFGKPVAQTNAPAFGAPASASLFPPGSQTVPSFGSLSSNVQSPAFGQQSTQPSFGSATAPPSAGSFPFGGTNFNFGNAGSTGVFTFGSGANPAQPANPGFGFSQAASFNMGSNGKASTPSSISNRKIRTARRRK
ncbi:unnamed protein product [Staurois parvus]|uniref:Nuclear pore complex protein Nup153 n=1 Tax=Staurois parvus TaxID=386267 RepID=A0ABN9C0W5_9NEOB|nr:unnamed protein product [Staurois parvus]